MKTIIVLQVSAYWSSGLQLLKKYREDTAALEASRQELANAEKLFDLPITLYPNLQEIQKQMKGIEMIYQLYEDQMVRFLYAVWNEY